MKIAILSDRSILKHPFGRLLVESLIHDDHEVALASADIVNETAFYDFSKSDKILNNFGEVRVAKYQLIKKRFRHIRSLRICVNAIKICDRSVTRFRARKIIPWKVYFSSAIKALRMKADVIIVSRPQTILVQLILACLKKTKIRKLNFVYYPYELYGEQFHKGKKSLAFLERLFVKHVYDAIVVPSNSRLDYYRSINPNIRGCILRNFKKFVPLHKKPSRQLGDLRLVYFGLIDYGRKIEDIVNELGLMPKGYKFFLVGEVRKQWYKDNQDSLNHWISEGKLELVAEIPEDMISKYLSNFDVGLISYDDSCLNNRLCAPAKVTDYLHAGLPIVAPDLPGMKEITLLNSNIFLYDHSDHGSLFKVLSEIALNLTTRSPGEISKSSSNLNWENEYKKFQDLLVSLRNEWALSGSNRRPTD